MATIKEFRKLEQCWKELTVDKVICSETLSACDTRSQIYSLKKFPQLHLISFLLCVKHCAACLHCNTCISARREKLKMEMKVWKKIGEKNEQCFTKEEVGKACNGFFVWRSIILPCCHVHGLPLSNLNWFRVEKFPC